MAALGAVICLAFVPFTPIGVPILCPAAAVLVGLPAPDTDPEPTARHPVVDA